MPTYYIEIVDQETQDVIQLIGPKYDHKNAWAIYDDLQTPANWDTLDIRFVTDENGSDSEQVGA